MTKVAVGLHPHTYEGMSNGLLVDGKPFDVRSRQHVWSAATTLADFGSATADWLEGKIGHMPTVSYYRSVNEETQGLLPYINPLNRCGEFATTFSQPAASKGNDPFGAIFAEQRAAIDGFATDRSATLLGNLAYDRGLSVILHRPPVLDTHHRVVISREDESDITYLGCMTTPREIHKRMRGIPELNLAGLKPELIEILAHCAQIAIYDEEYGNNDRLWPMLLQASRILGK